MEFKEFEVQSNSKENMEKRLKAYAEGLKELINNNEDKEKD